MTLSQTKPDETELVLSFRGGKERMHPGPRVSMFEWLSPVSPMGFKKEVPRGLSRVRGNALSSGNSLPQS